MNSWGKKFTKEEAIQEIDNLYNRISEIEHSKEYAERSEAGDDTLWYQIEAYYEEIDYLKTKYDIEDNPVDEEYDDDVSEADWDA
jgi:hypothetical protein